MRRSSLLSLLVLLFAFSLNTGCEDDPKATNPADDQAEADTPSDTADGVEAEVDVLAETEVDTAPDSPADLPSDTFLQPLPAACAAALLKDQNLTLLPNAPVTQIHAAVQFDGEAIWLAYNAPDGMGNGGFDTFLVKLGCDGSQLAGPIAVHEPTVENEVDPDLAVNGDEVFVAWSADDGVSLSNLSINTRTFHLDGTPLTAPLELATTRGGLPVMSNHWLPMVAPLPAGQFAITGVRVDPDDRAFETFVQRVDGDGSLVGEAIDVGYDGVLSDGFPDLAAATNGDLLVVWPRGSSDVEDRPYYVEIAAGADAPTAAPQVLFDAAVPGSGPSVAIDGGGRRMVAMGTTSGDPQIVLKDFDAPGRTMTVGEVGQTEHSPGIALAPGGGALMYFRVLSGFRNLVVAQGFADDGETLAPGRAWTVPVEVGAAPYGPAITYLGDDVYFLVWAEGTSPNFLLKGRFMSL